MLSRRTFTATLASLVAFFNLKPAGASVLSSETITSMAGWTVMKSLAERGHTLFGTSYEDNNLVTDMEWQPANTRVDLGPKAHLGSDMTREQYESEIYTAVMNEHLAVFEQAWLDRVKRHAGERSIFSQSSVTGNVTFIGDVHAALGVLINREINRRTAADQPTNTIIVSPVALTILQSSTTSSFIRHAEGDGSDRSDPNPRRDPSKSFGPRYVGFFPGVAKDGKTKTLTRVLVDCYADGGQPVLIGFIPDDPRERLAAVVMTGPTSMDYGERPNAHTGWDAVGIDSSSLSFI